jgi:hypothetical protein
MARAWANRRDRPEQLPRTASLRWKRKYPGSGWHWPHAKAECAHRATFPDDRPRFAGYRSIMINLAINYFWYFRYDSSLAAGGSRSI